MILLTKEDVDLLTDRWGDTHRDLTDDEQLVVNRLIPIMYSEESFIVLRNGVPGLMIECELVTPGEDDDAEVLSCWGRVVTYDEVVKLALLYAEHIGEVNPVVQAYACQHDGCWRVCVRAFIPSPHCIETLVQKVGDALMELCYS